MVQRAASTENKTAAGARALALEAELLQAEADFAAGDYIELSADQIDHSAATGESPWPRASLG